MWHGLPTMPLALTVGLHEPSDRTTASGRPSVGGGWHGRETVPQLSPETSIAWPVSSEPPASAGALYTKDRLPALGTLNFFAGKLRLDFEVFPQSWDMPAELARTCSWPFALVSHGSGCLPLAGSAVLTQEHPDAYKTVIVRNHQAKERGQPPSSLCNTLLPSSGTGGTTSSPGARARTVIR